jgi:DNA-binding NarL/FixJ family response regulator
MGTQTGVFVLSSNRLLRESIERLIRKKSDLDLLGACPLDAGSIRKISDSGAEVLVLDSLQFIIELDGWRVAPLEVRQKIKIVMVAMDDDKRKFLGAVKQGVLAYVLQDSSAIDIICAIRAAAIGEATCPPHFLLTLFDFIAAQPVELPNPRRRSQWSLSRREQQLIPLIGSGMTNIEIARQLNLAEDTVKGHVHRILRKVGVADRRSVVGACQADSAVF